MKAIKAPLFFVLKMVCAFAIIWFLLSRSGVKAENIVKVDFTYMLLSVMFLFAQNFLTAARWHFLMRSGGLELKFSETFSLAMQGFFFTLFIPAGAVGGDVVKAGFLAARTDGRGRFDGVFSIVMDRVCGFAGLMALTLMALLFNLRAIFAWPNELRIVIGAIAAFCVFGLAAAGGLFFCDFFLRFGFLKNMHDRLDKLAHGAFSRIEEAAAFYRSSWKTFAAWALASGIIFFPLVACSLYCANLAAGASAPDKATSFLAAVCGEVVSIIPITPGGIGTRDALSTALFKASGHPAAESALTPVVFTLVLIITNLPGVFFWAADAFRKKNR